MSGVLDLHVTSRRVRRVQRSRPEDKGEIANPTYWSMAS